MRKFKYGEDTVPSVTNHLVQSRMKCTVITMLYKCSLISELVPMIRLRWHLKKKRIRAGREGDREKRDRW